ncbi:MAG: DUF1501 domain-containing protein [Planctomycetes bacterium]|nr:DUF1501 domain-containing protein [Planctomycetota bacterium]
MLDIFAADSRCTRRRFLTAGGLALGGLSLAALRAADAPAPHPLATGKAVIFLFQQGGPSQFETFDPKPDAPDGVRTVGGVTKTAIPGVTFGDTFQQLAKVADKFTVVRSFATGNAEHNIKPVVGPESLDASIGALYARVVGATHPVTAMPSSAVLFPQAVDATVAKGQGRGDLAATGSVGGAFAPFVPGGGGQLQKNLRLNLPADRFHERRGLLDGFDRTKREAEERFDDFTREQRQACEVLLRGSVADALDLSRENPRTVARYDTSHHVAKDNWDSARRGKRGYYTGHAKALGKSLLMARRLCEAGCGFVTVHTGYEGVWDMHADGENLNMKDGMQAIGRSFDHAVAAFIEDVEARGLGDKILLVACGEMGRTPRLNKTGGRDHWARLSPLFLYGGGAAAGKVIGRSTRDGGEPDGDYCATPNLISTILHTVFDVGQLRLKPALGAIAKLAEVRPIV